MIKRLIIIAIAVVVAMPLAAQQSGEITGQITTPDGETLPGVTVEATSDVLPRARVTTSGAEGRFTLPLLPPGDYEVAFSLEGMDTETRQVRVLLDQESVLNVAMGAEEFTEEITVISESLIDFSSAEISNALSSEALQELPLGQQYRDVQKLIPGVQYTEDGVRGPSAGGSGQDNVYLFDGTNVGLPLFGVLSAEPSTHDIDQVSVVRGGATATDFNRSGGFTINTVSKSGTNRYHGEVGYQIQTADMTGDRDVESAEEFEQDEDWSTANVGGPLLRDQLFFYASYYRPTVARDNRANVYGDVPDFDSTRDEFFGKLTFSPIDSLLIHGSYRDSERDGSGASVGTFSSGSTSQGEDATLEIGILEGTWVLGADNFLNFKYADFSNETASLPDNLFGFPIAIDGSVMLDVNNLDQQGLFNVPQPIPGEPGFNAFIAPIIQEHGFLEDGVLVGGGQVGGDNTINNQDFFRESVQAGYDHLLDWGPATHELHVGYQWSSSEEDLNRLSNGWGSITVPGGRFCVVPDSPDADEGLVDCANPDAAGAPAAFYTARFEQQSLGGGLVPSIRSEFESQNIELNDTIRWNDWTFNVGVLLSNDTYYGQGLRENSANLSGFELAPGNEYEMYDIGFDEMVQPRLGAVWAYNGTDTVFANWSRYYPAASSLPRAASWDRNLRSEIVAHFDAQGNLLHSTPIDSSSGKFFDEGLDPRAIDEIMLGTAHEITPRWTLRGIARYRYGYNFWEDTNNTARVFFEPPPGIPQEPYIPDLDQVRAEIGGSSYVIAELDGAFTKYYEASVEADYRGERTYLKGSFVWSHYYGNFDQDNTTTENDQAIFIGSSFLADGAGRQIWDFRYGDLRGDRRYQLKLFGSYQFDWNGSLGAFAVVQDGQPWEAWNVEVYRDLTSSTSDTSRFAEPAGSRRTDDHYQLDLNYTHEFYFADRYTLQLIGEVFNVLDEQTGYNIQNKVNTAGFGTARSFFRPRRFQLAARFQF